MIGGPILNVVGARPQFIKAAPVSKAFREAGLAEILLHTGQHYDADMSDVFFEELGLTRPDINLEVGGGNHGAQTGAMLAGIENAILERKPAMVLVYGDTNSTLAGALAAVKLHVPVAHLEAGLRSHNRRMPEEINRILADHASDLLLTPTLAANEHLRHEGIPDEKVELIGDVMYDAALQHGSRAEQTSQAVSRLNLTPKGFALATIHRAENVDDETSLKAIFATLQKFSQEMPVVLPRHPRTKKALEKAGIAAEGIMLIDPVGYLDMVMLERSSALVITDSGGVQKEAYFHGVPCVTLRAETEWVELVDMGWNRLAPPPDSDSMLAALRAAVGSKGQMGLTPYGTGDSSVKAVSAIRKFFARGGY